MRIGDFTRLLPGAIALLLIGAGPATQPEGPATEKELLDRVHDQINQKAIEFDRWPSIGEMKIEDVLVLDLEGPALSPRTLIGRSMRERSFTLAEMPGPCGALLRFTRAGKPSRFLFERLDTSNPDLYAFADLNAFPQKVEMTYWQETIRESWIIQLIDDRANNDPSSPHPDGECRVDIQVFDATGELLVTHAKLVEEDLPSVIRLHRTAADIYLRPMLHVLGQDRLMLPDTHVARQVMSAPAKVDAALSKKVVELVSQLDADDFSKRQAASVELKKLGVPGTEALLAMDRGKLSAEQHNRVDEILNAVHPLSADEAEKLAGDKAFLIDCLELDDADVRMLARAKLEAVTGQRIVFDAQADLPARLDAAAKLRAKLLPAQLDLPRASPTTREAPASIAR